IAARMEVDSKSVQAYTMGEHGDSQFVPWSNVSVGGKRFYDIIADNPERFGDIELDHFVSEIIDLGFKIGRIKGTTNYAIAATVVEIIKVMLNDENRVIPVSTLLNGEYDESDVFAGVPAVINRQGVKEIVCARLTDEEIALFGRSVAIIREYNQSLSF
ncbi:MAG: L-lactate dehydrogenase, partial [Acetanaerobacterium sp.]